MSVCVRQRETRSRRDEGGREQALRHEQTPKLFWHGILQALNSKREELLWFPPTAYQGGGKKMVSGRRGMYCTNTRAMEATSALGRNGTSAEPKLQPVHLKYMTILLSGAGCA